MNAIELSSDRYFCADFVYAGAGVGFGLHLTDAGSAGRSLICQGPLADRPLLRGA
jgi:hypothetical protein